MGTSHVSKSNGMDADAKTAASLIEIAEGSILPRCIHVVAELGIADLIDEAPLSATSLAQAAKINADALNRVLRLMAAHGIFKQVTNGYAHTALSRQLRSDHPHSLRAYARMIGSPFFWHAYGELLYSVTTGEPAAKKLDPGGIFAYLKKHPHEGAIFNAAMEAKAQRDIQAVTSAYDFSQFRSIADIGGGRGHLLKAILQSAPKAKGVLFDQPHVLQEAGASERLMLHPGDFFAGGLPSCEAYIVMEVLHDWNEAECAQILGSIRQASPNGAKLLVLETVVPDDNQAHFSQTLDIIMLTITGGRERTKDEYAKLLAASGFRLSRLVETGTPCSILEAVVV